MHQEAETSIGSSDTNRIIRYIDSHPVVVANDSFDAVAHDIERFCAFRQRQLHESELSGDLSVGELQKAREFRNKLLESVDKTITIVHLLTNTSWGESVPTRFLSCRQSTVARDRVSVVGDVSVASGLRQQIRVSRDLVSKLVSRHSDSITLLRQLKECRLNIESRVSSRGMLSCIDLVPSVTSGNDRIVCSVSFVNDSPKVECGRIIESFVLEDLALHVSLQGSDGSESGFEGCGRVGDGAFDRILTAQRCALDYSIVRALQEEPTVTGQGTVRIHRVRMSQHKSDFSVDFALVDTKTSRTLRVQVGMKPIHSCGNISNISNSLRKFILVRNSNRESGAQAMVEFLVNQISNNHS